MSNKIKETINEKLNIVNGLTQSIKDHSKLCESLLIYNQSDENVSENIDSFISSILKDIETLKEKQYQIASINFENTIIYNNKNYKITKLIKLKEQFKLQSDFISTIIPLIEKNLLEIDEQQVELKKTKTEILLKYQVELNNIRKESNIINSLLSNYNLRMEHA
jgi:hypothetical protein